MLKNLTNKTIAVISGGGSWGAYTVGRLKKMNKNYDVVVGCSTGSLMAPLVVLGKYDRLIEAYTSVTSDAIFNKNPFTKKGNLNILRIITRVITGKITIGETKSLKETIKKFFTIEDYYEILNSDKEVIITITNLSSKINRTEYKSIREHSYEDFVDYMWASASIPMLGTLIKKDGKIYCDGGTTEAIPILYTTEKYNKSYIDCFIHRLEHRIDYTSEPKNIIQMITRLVDVQRAEIFDEHLAHLGYFRHNHNVNLYFLPENPEKKFTTFDKDTMKRWVEIGFNSI